MKNLLILLVTFNAVSTYAQTCVVNVDEVVKHIGIDTVFRNAFDESSKYTFHWSNYKWKTLLDRKVSISGLGNPKHLHPELLSFQQPGWELITSELGEASLRSTDASNSHQINAPEHISNLKPSLTVSIEVNSEESTKVGMYSHLTERFIVLRDNQGTKIDSIRYWKRNPWAQPGVAVSHPYPGTPTRHEILKLIQRNLRHCH